MSQESINLVITNPPQAAPVTRIYHGWIFQGSGAGFYVAYRPRQGEPVTGRHATRWTGASDLEGLLASVDWFEVELELGHVFLEWYPMGYRVYTCRVEGGPE